MIVMPALGQEVLITVKGPEGNPLAGATVQLLDAGDSSVVFRIADGDGRADFGRLPSGLYRLDIRFLGYQPFDKTFLLQDKDQHLTCVLEPESLGLEEVTVVARRPLIRQEDDKMIVDPEPIAQVSLHTLEVLEKTPGVFVDQDGYIYLNSATPAQVFINGREQKMSAQDMAAILRNLPPTAIQRIEILRTPSARYDAASSGGIVNVVLKKGIRLGRNGSVHAGMNQGHYGDRFAGFSLNDHHDNTSWYLRVQGSHREGREELTSLRVFGPDSSLTQVAGSHQPGLSGYLGYGVSLSSGRRWDFSHDGRVHAGWSGTESLNTNQLRDAGGHLLADNRHAVQNDGGNFSIHQDLGALYRLDTLGSEWDTQFSYSYSENSNLQEYQSTFLWPVTGTLPGEGQSDQNRSFWLLQSDLTWKPAGSWRVEAGIKGTAQWMKAATIYTFLFPGGPEPDPGRTNSYRYEERIHAAYVQASHPLPAGLLLKAGLRAEHTWMKGVQTVPDDATFTLQRTDLFPYVYLSRSLFPIAGYDLRGYLIYRRSVMRPGYQSLSPNIRLVDPFLYETGNPGLRPQFTENYEANVSFDEFPVFAIGRNEIRDIFSQVIYPDTQDARISVRTWDNVGLNRETYFRVVGALPPGGKYFFVAGAQYNLNAYEGLYEGQPLRFQRGSWRFFTFHMLNLTPDTRLTLSGFMVYRGQQNFYELENFGQLNAGFNQSFFDKKLQISLSVNDILRTMPIGFRLRQGSLDASGERYNDNRRYGIQLRYQFGLKPKEEKGNLLPMDVPFQG